MIAARLTPPSPGIRVTANPGRPVALECDGDPVSLRRMERALVSAIAVSHPEPTPIEGLVALLWPNGHPRTARQSVHNHLSRLRSCAPGLIESVGHGYAFGAGVHIEVGVDPAAVEHPDSTMSADRSWLPDLDPGPGLRRRIGAFRRRWARESNGDDFTELLRRIPLDDLEAQAQRAVERDPTDERNWWRLVVCLAALGRPGDVTRTIDRSRHALADVGLEPGHRLIDVERMAQRGITDVDRLVAHGYGRVDRSLVVEQLGADDLDAIRHLLGDDREFVVEVVGPEGPARSNVLAQIVHEARVHGSESRVLPCHEPGEPPSDTRIAWAPHRPAVIAIDGAEHSWPADELRAWLRADHPTSGRTPVSMVLTSQPPNDRVDDRCLTPIVNTGSVEADLTIVLPDTVDEDVTGAISRVEPPTRHLLDALALVGAPVDPDELAELSGATSDVDGELRRAERSGVLRRDPRTGRIDFTSPAHHRAVDRSMDEATRAALAPRIMEIELESERQLARAARRGRLAADALGATSPEAIAVVIAAARLCQDAGDLRTSSSLLQRHLDAIERADGRTLPWGRLAVEAGRSLLAAGDRGGEQILIEAIEVCRGVDDEVAARALLELCRLGPASTVGSSDPRNTTLIEDMIETVHDSTARALIGAAASMVFSFANEPDRLRNIFDAAERDARSSDDPELLVDVLPYSYMSLPLPSDLTRRARIVDELAELSRRFDRPDGRWESLQLRFSNEVMRGTGDVRATFRDLEACTATLHERARRWEMTYLRSCMALLDGDLAAARSHIDESLLFAGHVHPERVTAVFGANHLAISLLDRSTGDFVDVVEQMAADQPEVRAWRAAFALAAAAAGRHHDAADALHRLSDDDLDDWPGDHTLTSSLVVLGEAAVLIDDAAFVDQARTLLAPFASYWSWCGSCTFGPIDLTLARLALAAGDTDEARRCASRALRSAADLRSPLYADAATAVLLDTV